MTAAANGETDLFYAHKVPANLVMIYTAWMISVV